jgi:hypothetical protein
MLRTTIILIKLSLSRVEAYKSKKRTSKVSRDIMQDIKTKLDTDKKEEDKKDVETEKADK